MGDERYQKIVVTGFLLHDGKALIIRRSEKEKYLPGFYELPGGKSDFGEDPGESLKREYKEEVNLNVEVGKPYRAFHYVSDEGKRHTIEIVFAVKLDDDPANLKLGKDHDDHQWVELEKLDDFNITDEMKQSIKEGFDVYACLNK